MVTLSTLQAGATAIFAAYEGVEPVLADLCAVRAEGTSDRRCCRISVRFEDAGEWFIVSLDDLDIGVYGMMKASGRLAVHMGPFSSFGALRDAMQERAASYAAEPLHSDESP